MTGVMAGFPASLGRFAGEFLDQYLAIVLLLGLAVLFAHQHRRRPLEVAPLLLVRWSRP